jgi:hypothetical protein
VDNIDYGKRSGLIALHESPLIPAVSSKEPLGSKSSQNLPLIIFVATRLDSPTRYDNNISGFSKRFPMKPKHLSNPSLDLISYNRSFLDFFCYGNGKPTIFT